MNEINKQWVDIKGYEGLYQISSEGEVLNVPRQKIKKPRLDKDGYFLIDLSKNNQATTFRLNRLVAKHFLDCPINMDELAVDHIDGNKQNNHVDNLQWLTLQENNCKRDLSNIQTKIVQVDKKTGEILQHFNSIREAARAVNTPHNNIIRVLNKENLSAGGFRWRTEDV